MQPVLRLPWESESRRRRIELAQSASALLEGCGTKQGLQRCGETYVVGRQMLHEQLELWRPRRAHTHSRKQAKPRDQRMECKARQGKEIECSAIIGIGKKEAREDRT